MLLKQYIADVRKRTDAATPGPWVSIGNQVTDVDGEEIADFYNRDNNAANRKFCQEARTDVTILRQALEAAMDLLNLAEDVITSNGVAIRKSTDPSLDKRVDDYMKARSLSEAKIDALIAKGEK